MRGKYTNFLAKRAEKPKNYLQVDETKGELFLYDEIGYWGINAEDVTLAIKELDPSQRLTVCINSPGGEVFDGIAIYNLLKGRGNVDVRIDGFAASIASVIAMAGEKVAMAENAMMMIHNPFTIVYGDAEDMRSEAVVLDKIKDQVIATYRKRSDLSAEEISDLMDKETWFTSEEAKASGFVDEVLSSEAGGSEPENSFDLSIYRNCPDRLRGNGTAQPQSGGGDASALRRYHFNRRHEINLTSL